MAENHASQVGVVACLMQLLCLIVFLECGVWVESEVYLLKFLLRCYFFVHRLQVSLGEKTGSCGNTLGIVYLGQILHPFLAEFMERLRQFANGLAVNKKHIEEHIVADYGLLGKDHLLHHK